MLNRIGAVLARTYPVRLAMAFGDSQAGNYASGLAFTSFVSMFPLILGLLAVLGLVVWLAFMTAIYRLVPNRTYTVRRMWPGVLLAGVLMEALTLLWPLYTRLTHGFNTYGSAFALFFVLATWLYFFALFTLLGAVANRMHAGGPSVGGLIATPTRDQPV